MAMKKSSLLPTVALLVAVGILLLWRAPVRTKILLVVLVVPASMIGAALTGYAAQIVSRRYRESRLYKTTPKQRDALRITAAGRKYACSPAYEMQIVAAVAQFWVPEKEFYELILNMTAMCLSESDRARAGAAAFKQFVADNLPTIRAAIDRVKISQPAIKLSEENWERAQNTYVAIPASKQSR
jgi:hypothetical protein